MIKTVKKLRNQYFPHKLAVGNCIEVCILVGSILKYEQDLTVHLVHGDLKGCLHTWLSVSGIQIDPSTDCTDVTDGREFVTFINPNEYLIHEVDEFHLSDYFVATSIQQLKDMTLNN